MSNLKVVPPTISSSSAWTAIKYAELHDGLFIPGVGDFPKRIVKGAEGKTKDMEMFLTPVGLILNIKGIQTLVPLTNIKGLQPETKIVG